MRLLPDLPVCLLLCMSMKIRDLAQKYPNWFFCSALCAVVALANIRVVSGRQYISWDSYHYFYPKFLYFADSLKAGYFPLWNSFELSGVPFVPWNGFVFNPLNFIFVALAQWFNPLYVFQFMLLSLVFIGGAGAWFFFNSLNYPRNVSWFGSLAFSLTMYGVLLGQYSIAYGVAFTPWGLYALNHVLDRQGRITVNQTVLYALALCFFITSAYPVMIFLVAVLLGAYGVCKFFVDRRLRDRLAVAAVVKRLFVICFLGGLCASFISIPMIENRSYVARGLRGDFTAPDPWLRVFLGKSEQVCGYDANFLNYLKSFVSPAGWSAVSGVAVLFLGVLALTRFFRDSLLRFLFLLLVLFISYTHGRGSVFYEFVADHIPVFGNNRYPLIGLLMFKVVLLVIATHYLAFLAMIDKAADHQRGRELLKIGLLGLVSFFLLFGVPYYKPFLIIGVSGVAFSILSFQYLKGKIPAKIYIGCLVLSLFAQAVSGRNHYVDKINYDTEGTRSRVTSVVSAANFRDVTVSTQPWADNSWVFKKTPINQGYYMADTAPYWYLKNQESIKHFFYTTRDVVAEDMGIVRSKYKTDNEFVAALVSQVLSQKNGATVVDKMPAWSLSAGGKQKREKVKQTGLSNILIAPNELRVKVKTARPVLLALNDKYYPGWRVFVDGVENQIIKTNLCFKGVYLEAGTHNVAFLFRPVSFYLGLFISCFTLVGLGVWVALAKIKKNGAEAGVV